ncbi:MAG: hypothetical protein HY820_10750 [Acidobacteria bacterium]|nr:hypothetical protein [Acidobacteriota bacterium]
MLSFFWVLCALVSAADRDTIIQNPVESRTFKAKYVALTDSWVKGIVFTVAEERAMQEGKQREAEMDKGPDDPVAKRIRAKGEASWEALAAAYPAKILDRTILGTYSDPRDTGGIHDEFAIYWNGAIGANLIKGRLTDAYGATGVSPLAFNTAVEFRTGADGELFGQDRNHYSSIGYENGYLPIVTATYTRDGIRYRQVAFAHRPAGEWAGSDIAYVRFEITNTSAARQTTRFSERIVLNDGGALRFERGMVMDPSGAVLLAVDDTRVRFDAASGTLSHEFALAPGTTAQLHIKMPYLPDKKRLMKAPTAADFDSAHATQKDFWEALLSKASRIEVPDPRINSMYRALLAQNFVLADGPKYTYGSGLRYNDSTYPYESGFATHVFAAYGYKDYAGAMQRGFLPMTVTPAGAGRKYQNRRAMVLHHLLENYRLTGKTDLFERYKTDYYRVADEIVKDRRSTMTPGEKPLHWGLLPPDKPGVDVQASTQRVYVLGHNVTNCAGLQAFGHFLVKTGLDRDNGEKYLREAADFRKTLMSAMERAAIRLPDRPPFVDLQTLYFRQTPDYGPEPYDDLALGRLQGAYFHYWVDMEFHYNFFNPEDAVGQWLADYVLARNGKVLGLTRARRQDGRIGAWINNVYDAGYYNYRLRQGNVSEFVFGLYSKFVFGHSRYTQVASEGSPFLFYNTVNGGYVGADYSFPNSAANADTLLMLRNALVYEDLRENVETGKLLLLKGAPRAWLGAGKQIRVERLSTYYGDLGFTVNAYARTVRAKIDAPRGQWKILEIALRSAPRAVKVNGKPHTDFDAGGNVRLSPGAASYVVEAQY